MQISKEKLKRKFLEGAELYFDQLMEWQEGAHKPNFTQIENIVMEKREELGKIMAQVLIECEDKRQPEEKQKCPHCGRELENKGLKENLVESQIGEIRLKRNYYYCSHCRMGFFPPR